MSIAIAMADMAFCGCTTTTNSNNSSKLSYGFFATHKSLSSSEALFPSLRHFPSISCNEKKNKNKKAHKQYLFTAMAEASRSAVSAPSSYKRQQTRTPNVGNSKIRPRKGNRIMSRDGRPHPPRQKLLGVRDAILKPPLDDIRLANKFLRSPQLSLKTLPLLSSCLPFASLRAEDEEWMDRHFPEIKEALGYPLGEDSGTFDTIEDSLSGYPLEDDGHSNEEEDTFGYSHEEEDLSDNAKDSHQYPLEVKDSLGYTLENAHSDEINNPFGYPIEGGNPDDIEKSVRPARKDHSYSRTNTKISPDSPLFHRDTLLFLAFQHPESERGHIKSIKTGHSRIAFLGEYVLELALAEFLLMRYPRETPACLRERISGLINKKAFPRWMEIASLDGAIYPDGMNAVRTDARLQTIRGVFCAIVGALYLCMGMSEVYRFLFDVCGFNPDVKDCQPKPRLGREDVDYVFPPLEEKQVEWDDLSKMKTADDELFAKPMLYRACVPPGIHRFRGNLWEIDSLPKVLQIMGYPLPALDMDPAITMARNAELELGLQLCFLHPSMYKSQHPRFCNERFEFLGSKIQDVVMAEKLLMKHLDAPGFFLKEKHRRLLFNRVCGRYFREKSLQKFILFSEERKGLFEKARKLKNLATTAVSLALHGLAYTVYGKADVRRIMFELFDFERLQNDH